MKKILLSSVIVAIVLPVLALTLQPWRDATAQGDALIAATILERRIGWAESNLIEGSDCSFTGERFGDYNSNRMHFVVRDERGTVIAVHEVKGVIVPNVDFDFYTCEAIFDVPLPAAEFYTIHINDTYYVTSDGGNLGTIPVDIVREWQEDWHPVTP